MKNDYAWRFMTLMVVVCLMAAAVLTSCGGGGNTGLDNVNAPSETTDQAGSGLLTITEDEVGSLPAWQQELLSDPGWNQPPIPQRADTPMPAPSYEMLLQWQQEAQANPGQLVPRTDNGKSSSYVLGKEMNPGQPKQKGMYNVPFATAVTFGCKDTGGIGSPPMSKEKKIAAQPLPTGATQARTVVLRGSSSPNHFNTVGGSSNNAYAAVYQIFASSSTADPELPYSAYNPPSSAPTFAEISYRADGGPAAGGDPCHASAVAYTVRDFVWWKYNSTINALPGQATTALYNILIAPSSNISANGTSVGNTVGQYQKFYMGSLGAAYGGGWIVSLVSSTSTCATFANSIPNQRFFYTNPIYGVLLQRWQDSVLLSMPAPNNVPWKGEFGWPVQGPTAYNGGASTLTGNGAYFAWGMYFERGFFWWIDYINNATVPDEAQAYRFTGANVFCKGSKDVYEKLPTIYYGGGTSTPLGVSVVVEASLNPDRGPGSPPAGTYYEVANKDTPLLLDMHAHGYGGSPRSSDGRYKHYTWAFRDGTIGVTNGTAFDDSTKYVQHSYAEQSVYTVRVQVMDNNNAVGYGDSLPIHVGQGGGGGNGEVWLIRMDGGTYDTNADALKTEMDNLGVSYTEVDFDANTGADFIANAVSKVAIFYRGGPGSSSEPANTTAMTQAQFDAMRTILSSGSKRKVLFISQNHANANPSADHYYKPFEQDGGSYFYYYPVAKAFNSSYTTHTAAVGNYTELDEKIEGQQAFPLQAYTTGGNYYQGFYNYIDPGMYNKYCFASMRSVSYTSPIPFLRLGSYASAAAERYTGAGSSLKVPTSLSVNQNRQWNQRGYWTFSQAPYATRNNGFTPGMGVEFATSPTTQFGDQCLVSYGNSTAPGLTAGTGKYWVWGFSFNDLTINSPAGMTKADLLRNVLAWLDSSLTFSAKTNGGFQEYQGAPQIVSVTPAMWDEVNHAYRTGGQTAPWNGAIGNFPDQTGTNVYRTTAGNPPGAIITSDPNNNWINGNDLDFQHAFYAYVNDGGNGIEVGGTSGNNWNGTNDTIFYAGLLVSDLDLSWTRVAAPAGTPSIQLKEAANNTMNRNPVPVVAGWYRSTGVGGTADNQYANYGTQPDAFTAAAVDFTNASVLHVESVARWPQSLKYFNWTGPGGLAPNAPDAYLAWTVYPGQSMRVPAGPNVGKFIGINANWNNYLRTLDIDPNFAVAGRTGNAWNRPAFAHKDDPSQGRVINFNLRKVKEWNPDMNRDGQITVADKFPVRARIFTDHQTYYNKTVAAGAPGWPNHLANPGGDPATVPEASRNPSFIEGGTYIVDKGTPVYPLIVTDDAAAADPGAPGTLQGQGPGTYTAKIQFEIKYGVPNYKVEVDTWYNGTFGAGPNGNNGQPVPVVLAKDFATAPNAEGLYNIEINVPANQANGLYQFAVRVTDQDTPATVSTYVWPTLVNLVPQALLVEDFESGTMSKWTMSGAIGNDYPMSGYANMQFDFRNVTGQRYCEHPAAAYGYAFGGSMAPPQGSRMGVWGSPNPNDTSTYGPGAAQRFMTLTTGVPATPGQSYTISFKTNGVAYYEQSGNSYWYGGIAPQISWDNGATWEAGSAWSAAGGRPNYSHNSTVWGGYPYAFASSTNNAGGQWIQRTRVVTAPGGSPVFKIRFAVYTYTSPIWNGVYYYPTCGPQAIDDIKIQ